MSMKLSLGQAKQRLRVLLHYGYKRDKVLGRYYRKTWHNPRGENHNRAIDFTMAEHMDAHQLTGLLDWAEEMAERDVTISHG